MPGINRWIDEAVMGFQARGFGGLTKVRQKAVGTAIAVFVWLSMTVLTAPALAAPYAAIVMDARNGEVLFSRNADTRLHPASLTKMMTLYIAFEAVENGEIGLDDLVRISAAAEAEPPSELGLREGQQIAFRFLLRAAAVKSANDAATAIAEAIEGSEAAFARRMNRTAQAMGMRRTNFRNAHGLTQEGHMSTARDMNILGRHMIYDYPRYYNLFSRQSTHAGLRTVRNTNRRFLSNYQGADGIKTGYTRAAGSNLTASAERGRTRIVATIFGGQSSAWRDAHMAELMDLGFDRAPRRVALRRPARPRYRGPVAGRSGPRNNATRASTSSAQRSPAPSRTAYFEEKLRPVARPASWGRPGEAQQIASVTASVVAQQNLGSTVPSASTASAPSLRPPSTLPTIALEDKAVASDSIDDAVAMASLAPNAATAAVRDSDAPSLAPRARPSNLASVAAVAEEAPVLARLSTASEREWGVSLGRFTTRFEAEQRLIQSALAEPSALANAVQRVNSSGAGHDALFLSLTRDEAERTCRRLQARAQSCFMLAPAS